MGRNKGSIILSIIVGLAVIGFVSSLVKNPSGFLINILVMIGIAFVIFLIVRAVMNRRTEGTSDEMKKYRKAVKQSKQKYQQPEPKGKIKSSRTAPPVKQRKKRRHQPHLTVIDGKKSVSKQKDDRASN